jgi:hypothetical protein
MRLAWRLAACGAWRAVYLPVSPFSRSASPHEPSRSPRRFPAPLSAPIVSKKFTAGVPCAAMYHEVAVRLHCARSGAQAAALSVCVSRGPTPTTATRARPRRPGPRDTRAAPPTAHINVIRDMFMYATVPVEPLSAPHPRKEPQSLGPTVVCSRTGSSPKHSRTFEAPLESANGLRPSGPISSNSSNSEAECTTRNPRPCPPRVPSPHSQASMTARAANRHMCGGEA